MKPFSELTIADLELKAAQLTHQAAKLREEQATMTATSPSAGAVARRLVRVSARAAEYRMLLGFAQEYGKQATE